MAKHPQQERCSGQWWMAAMLVHGNRVRLPRGAAYRGLVARSLDAWLESAMLRQATFEVHHSFPDKRCESNGDR
jgi:hypothetical protein